MVKIPSYNNYNLFISAEIIFSPLCQKFYKVSKISQLSFKHYYILKKNYLKSLFASDCVPISSMMKVGITRPN